MTIELANGTVLDCLVVNGRTVYYQNSQRDSLEFCFSRDLYSLDQIESLFTQENTKKIILDNQYIYEDYTLRFNMTMEEVEIEPSTPNAPAVTQNQIKITMAQKTYLEKQLELLLENK